MKRQLLTLAVCFLAAITTSAQNKIKDGTVSGSPSTPKPGAVLELESNNKGLLIPRLTMAQRNAILPANLTDGLMIYNTDEGCYDYYKLSAASWVTYCGAGNSVLAAATISPVQCSAITVQGGYSPGVALTPTNYLAIPLTVTTAGSYTITGTSTNGYFFSVNGNFPGTGTFTINVPGSGTPANVGTDNITLKINDVTSTCVPTVTVGAAFTMNCGSIVTNGTYTVGTALTAANYLSVPVNVTAVGPYVISTSTVNGYSFSTSGTFTATGSQIINVPAAGTPATAQTDAFNITTNSSTGGTCAASVNVLYRTMRILGFGGALYTPGSTFFPSASANKILSTAANFGANGTVKVQAMNVTFGGDGGISGSTLTNTYNIANNYDILVFGYNAYPSDAAAITALNNFLKTTKGVIIYADEYNSSSTKSMLDVLLSATTTAPSNSGATLSNPLLNVNDPVLNGPFGDIRGSYGGNDVNNGYYYTGLPASVTTLATQDGTPSKVWAFKHNTLGLLVIGDSGWMIGNALDVSSSIYPCAITTAGIPITKDDYAKPVDNGKLYANAMAWAIKYIQLNRVP